MHILALPWPLCVLSIVTALPPDVQSLLVGQGGRAFTHVVTNTVAQPRSLNTSYPLKFSSESAVEGVHGEGKPAWVPREFAT